MRKQGTLCLAAADGQVLWRRDAGQGFEPRRGNPASSPSPVTDGKHVWFFRTDSRLFCIGNGRAATGPDADGKGK